MRVTERSVKSESKLFFKALDKHLFRKLLWSMEKHKWSTREQWKVNLYFQRSQRSWCRWIAGRTINLRRVSASHKLPYGPSQTSRLKRCRGKKLFTSSTNPAPVEKSCETNSCPLKISFNFPRSEEPLPASPYHYSLTDSAQLVYLNLSKCKNIIWGFGGSF